MVAPLGMAVRVAFGTSMVKFSRPGKGKCRARDELPVAEGGESPVDDGDMLWVRRRSCVEDVMGQGRSDTTDQAGRQSL